MGFDEIDEFNPFGGFLRRLRFFFIEIGMANVSQLHSNLKAGSTVEVLLLGFWETGNIVQICVCLFLSATSRTHFYYDQETQASKNFLKVLGWSWSGSMSSFTHLRLLSSFAKPNSVKLRQSMDGAPSPVLSAIKSYSRVSHLFHVQDVMMTMLLG
uniref:Uncharacterized protein n=1 Tax=Brassica oleracea var. oleracea TaxID=109376 RepID=A0A0D3CFY3_BRAOL